MNHTGGLGATGIDGLFNTQNTIGQQAAGGGLFNSSKHNTLDGGFNHSLGGGPKLGEGLDLGNKTGGM